MSPASSASKRIAVIGCGHVGTVTAAGLAHLGHCVTGVDIDSRRITGLSAASCENWEPGLQELLAGGRACGRLSFTTSFERAIPCAEYVFLCVDTPTNPDGEADLTHLLEAVDRIAPLLASPGVTVAVKSTAPVGTADNIEQRLRSLARNQVAGREVEVAVNPEFLREGSAVDDFLHPERIVVGARNERVLHGVAGLYRSLGAPIVCTDPCSAEMIKYASNAFLAARVSLINELALICSAVDADIDAVVNGIGRDSRIGPRYLTPGIGYGGSCLPKDVAALCQTARGHGLELNMLPAVQTANDRQHAQVAEMLARDLCGLDGKTIGVWGVAFKGGTEDLRESPALAVLRDVQGRGAHAQVYDPSLSPAIAITGDVSVVESAIEACANADALIVLADWPEFMTADFAQVRARMRGDLVLDGRNCLERGAVEGAGLVYQGVGRRKTARSTAYKLQEISTTEGASP